LSDALSFPFVLARSVDISALVIIFFADRSIRIIGKCEGWIVGLDLRLVPVPSTRHDVIVPIVSVTSPPEDEPAMAMLMPGCPGLTGRIVRNMGRLCERG
jgi:hypothetical protein